MHILGQFKINYERDYKSNYLVLNTKNDLFDENNYQVKMLLNNTINGLLPFELRACNDDIKLYYTITSKQPLNVLLLKQSIDYNQIMNLLNSLFNTIKNSSKYMLSSECFVINLDYIYVQPVSFYTHLCYVPDIKQTISITEQLKLLIEYLMSKVDKKDKDAIVLIHKLFSKTRELNFTANDLENIIKNNNININEIKLEEINNNESNISKSYFEKDNKKYIEKVLNYGDKIVEEKEMLYYPIKYKVIAGIIQCAMITLIAVVLLTNTFVRESTGELDIVKLVAFIVLLTVVDIYICMKIFIEKNKVSKIIKVEQVIDNELPQVVNEDIDNNLSKAKKTLLYMNKKISDYEEETFNKDECGNLNIQSDNNLNDDLNSIISNYIDDECITTVLSNVNHNIAYIVDSSTNEKIQLHTLPFIIGKLKNQVDYVINNPTVSRVHAQIIMEENKYYIMDLNSKNGTYVNGESLTGQEKQLINHKDKIRFSNSDYEFNIHRDIECDI